MNLRNVLPRILGFFASDKAQAALNLAASLVPTALPIVTAIAAATPNRTDDELVAAFTRFAVPFDTAYLATPADQRGYVLMHLATQMMAAKVPSVATTVLNAAVQFAVTGALAK